MLRAHSDPRDDRRADDERDRELAAGEVVQLRRLVEDLVHGDADEVEELDLAHRPHTRDREADRETDGARFAQRAIAHDVVAVALPQTPCDSEGAAVRADVLSEQHHRLRPRECFVESAIDRLAHGQRRRVHWLTEIKSGVGSGS